MDVVALLDIEPIMRGRALALLHKQRLHDAAVPRLLFPDFTAGLWKTRQPIFAFDERC